MSGTNLRALFAPDPSSPPVEFKKKKWKKKEDDEEDETAFNFLGLKTKKQRKAEKSKGIKEATTQPSTTSPPVLLVSDTESEYDENVDLNEKQEKPSGWTKTDAMPEPTFTDHTITRSLGRLKLGMDFGKRWRQQSITRHHEEHASLTIHHHQHN